MANASDYAYFSSSSKRIKLNEDVEAVRDMEENCESTSADSRLENEDFEIRRKIAVNNDDHTDSDTKELYSIGDDNDDADEEDDDEVDDDDDDDVSSTYSNVSDISCLSDMSGQQWKPMASIIGTINWIKRQMLKGVNPRVVIKQLNGDSAGIPDTMSDISVWKLIFAYLTEPPKRMRLPRITTLNHVIHLLKTCSKIIVLTGAGVSVSCGIPDFRSKDGVYARLAVDFPNLPDPQSMFDINFFRQDPRPFFKFAKEIYPGQFKPSPCHRFIKLLEKNKKLLRNYTQNIDTLERVAGIENVVECHGSFSTASCTSCGYRVTCDVIKDDVFQQRIPFCPKCPDNTDPGQGRGVMKPDIVFFGEGLPETFHDAMAKDKGECDLLIIIGSSLKVRPVALIPSSLPGDVPQILINRERLTYMNFDVELLGDSDVIVDQICHMLGDEWKDEICWRETPLIDCTDQLFSKHDLCYNSSSSDDESRDEIETTNSHQTIRCQKIGRRHIHSDENSRHMSLDSSRDSGIGESSNSSSSSETISPTPTIVNNVPENSFYCIRKRRYIFPGAELPDLPSILSKDVA